MTIDGPNERAQAPTYTARLTQRFSFAELLAWRASNVPEGLTDEQVYLVPAAASVEPGPTEAALRDSWPQLSSLARDVRWAVALDRAGATERDVRVALGALRDARHVRDEWAYFTMVVLDQISRDWPQVRECNG